MIPATRCGWLGVLLIGLTLSGCQANRAPVEPPPDPAVLEAEASVQPPAPGLVEYFRSDLPVSSRVQQAVAEGVAPFTWTGELSGQVVPDQPVTGRVGGRDFVARWVVSRPDEEARRPTTWLRFSNEAQPAGPALSLTDLNVNLELPQQLAKGVWQRKLGEALPPTTTAYYSLQTPASPGATPALVTGSGYDWACWLSIDEVQGPVEPGGVETLVGRIALVFDDPAKSWIAGRFSAEGRVRLP